MIPRPCLDCGTPSPNTRCPIHSRQHDRTRRPSFHDRGYDAAYQRLRRQIITAEPWCHWPSGCNYPLHPIRNPLSADHVTPLRSAGYNLGLQVLCMRHNREKGGRLGL